MASKGKMNDAGGNDRYDPVISFLSHNADEVINPNNEEIYILDTDHSMCSLVHL